jgi:hypothetical protein
VVAAALGAVAEEQSSRERTDAGERTHDNAAGPRKSPIPGPTNRVQNHTPAYAHARDNRKLARALARLGRRLASGKEPSPKLGDEHALSI